MKQLLVMRHAKAQQPMGEQDDLSRPLAPRGERNAPAIGRCLKLAKVAPQRIVTSPAARAHRTAKLVGEACGYRGELEVIDGIYGSSTETLLGIARGLDDAFSCVLLVGHNPDLEHLVWTLCGPSAGSGPWAGLRLPTGAVALIDLSVDLWRQTGPGCGRVEWSLPPKLALAIHPGLDR